MKTNAAFYSLVGLALTTIFAASSASAQLTTSVPKKKTSAVSTLKTTVAPEAQKSPWSVSLIETGLALHNNDSNFIETDFTLTYAINKDFALSLYTGYESHFNKTEESDGYDVQPGIGLTNIKLGPISGSATLIAIAPTSRASQEANASFGYGGLTDFSTTIGIVGLDLDSEFYQFAYKNATGVPTPAIDDDLSSDKVYGQNSSDAFSVLTVAVPVTKSFAVKSGFRYRVKTPLIAAQDKELFRFQPKVAYTVNSTLSFVAGVQWQKDFNNPAVKDVSFFDDSNRAFFFGTSISI